MLPSNAGSSSNTGSAAPAPLMVTLTEDPVPLRVRSMWCPSVVGKFFRLIAFPELSQDDGMPRPITSEPSDRWAAMESSSTMLALASTQAGGDERLPDSG